MISKDKRLTNIKEKPQKKLEPVKEMRESTSSTKPVKKEINPNDTGNYQEITGNSFFNDVTLNMKKNEGKPHISLKQTPKIIGKSTPAPPLNSISENKVPNSQTKGFNVYQMGQAKPNVESKKKSLESESLGTKIKRENVNQDLNCTINDESILEYLVDENGYLMNEKGQLLYDDDGKVVKLTDQQIDKFKDEEMYEEVEF